MNQDSARKSKTTKLLEAQLRASLAEVEATFARAELNLTKLPEIDWRPLPPLEETSETINKALTIPELPQ